MNKEKIIITITVGIVCLLLVMTMFMQFKVVNETDIASLEAMTESELRSELSEIKSISSKVRATQKYEVSFEYKNNLITKVIINLV